MLRMRTLLSTLLLLLLISCSISIAGCKTTEHRLIYVGFAETPEEAKGAIKIATNEPIPVTIEGKEDVSTKADLGGYYAVRAADLKAFVEAVRKLQEVD